MGSEPIPGGQTVLIVDDHKGVRTALSEVLNKAGYKTVAVENGKLAVEAAKQHKPDVILLDIIMPEGDGVWACVEIRKLPGLENTPIIMCTVRGTKDDVDTAIAAGASDYVVKPFHPEMLLRKVQRLLAGEETSGGERRGAHRRDLTTTMVWKSHYPPPSGVIFQASVMNLSVTGVAFRYTPDPPNPDYAYESSGVHPMHPLYRYATCNPSSEPVELRIDLPGEGPVQAEGKFVYILRNDDEEMCGIQFTAIPDIDQRRLGEYVLRGIQDLVGSDD